MSNDLTSKLHINDLLSDRRPLWLWDGIAGRIYWANDAGLEFWHVNDLDELRDHVFDHAMPALRRLRKLALEELPDKGRQERLLFWTARGNRRVSCTCLKIAVDGYGDLLLLRLDELKPSPHAVDTQYPQPPLTVSPPAPRARTSETQAASNTGIDETDVAATLQEIARQVRAESKFAEKNTKSGMPSSEAEKIGENQTPSKDLTRAAIADDKLSATPGGEQQNSIDKVDFLAKVSHEVRTPLNSILGFSELMMQERFGSVENKKYAEYISDIHHSAELALSLINDMLDLSRINAGQFEVKTEEVELNALSRSMLSIMRPQAEKRSIAVKIELAERELIIEVDQRALKQILLNILSNAMKFTSPGGGVNLSTGSVGQGLATIKISDTGSGMTGPQITQAMQPYKKLDTTAHQIEGTGLGLPITKALVQANGGTFEIESEPGEGTSVLLTFPLSSSQPVE